MPFRWVLELWQFSPMLLTCAGWYMRISATSGSLASTLRRSSHHLTNDMPAFAASTLLMAAIGSIAHVREQASRSPSAVTSMPVPSGLTVLMSHHQTCPLHQHSGSEVLLPFLGSAVRNCMLWPSLEERRRLHSTRSDADLMVKCAWQPLFTDSPCSILLRRLPGPLGSPEGVRPL